MPWYKPLDCPFLQWSPDRCILLCGPREWKLRRLSNKHNERATVTKGKWSKVRRALIWVGRKIIFRRGGPAHAPPKGKTLPLFLVSHFLDNHIFFLLTRPKKVR